VQLGQSEAELVARVGDVEALVVRSATKITRRVIEAAPKLRVIGRAGVGVDNVDSDAATERGVVVMNTPTGNTTTTAELAVALLCALARHVPRADRGMRKGSWSKKGLMGTELAGKTLGVIGLGRIGRVVASRALGLELSVLAYDPYLAAGSAPMKGVELVELDQLLAESDFVTLHVPLSDSTRHLISRERLAQMKKGARLINAARGGLVDEGALAESLAAGHLAGAALDVFEVEPPAADNPLLAREDVILTPHLGASSHEAQLAVAVDVAQQIADFLLEGVANNAVNAPATSAQALREIAPYVLLAEKLGSLLAQLHERPIAKIELALSGEIAVKDHRHVQLALLAAILRQGLGEGVNFVNAPHLATQRGLSQFVTTSEADPIFHSQIQVATSSRDGAERHTAAGTLFGRAPRIVRIDAMHLDLDPKGPLLITNHEDRPGVVGLLGTVLGAHRVNIRRIELGPPGESSSASGLATGFLTLYEEPPSEVLAHIANLEPVKLVKLIRL
jgi:D-3-phosphoglycerate dehydrogenase